MTRAAPRWWSQPVAAEGSIASEGIRRQLGKPHLDPLTVLIRETAQNSCDAALPGNGDVEFAVRLHQLSGNRLKAWSEFLLPEPVASNLDLSGRMARGPLIMTIADRGTTGLGGPLRADESALSGERPDFVNFIRNVGEPKAVGGGGSYGFGKGILYTVSRCHLIVADSVCVFRGRRQRRLIGAALGDGYTHDGRRYTGRHWLGPLDDGFARPLLDDEATDLASRLGLPRFDDDATGTTLVIVDVDLGRLQRDGVETARDPDTASQYIASTMLWNLWPRMISGGYRNRLVCSMRRDGFAQDIPDPESLIELKPFVDAYRALADGGDHEIPPRKQQPREIGRFARKPWMAAPRPDPLLAAAAPFEGRAHHCARMRQADLVVDYLPGDVPADEMVQYGAVFRASAEADPFFVESEPPTHDDWVLNGLRGTARGVVQLAGSFIRDRLHDQARPDGPSAGDPKLPLAHLAGRLAGLMAGGDGERATPDGPAGNGSGGGRPRAGGAPRFVDGPALVEQDGHPVLRGVVQIPDWARPRVVVLEPYIVVDGGLESPTPGQDAPRALDWRHTDTGQTVTGSRLDVPAVVRVKLTATDAVVRVKSTATDGPPA
jgi:hypothetical protein